MQTTRLQPDSAGVYVALLGHDEMRTLVRGWQMVECGVAVGAD
jgi:hypothetical protein